MAKTESGQRKLKPVIEKKRRDRINQNLAVLRALLFNSTADTRLQNPRLEKAEILDLAVQYIKKNTCDRTDKKGYVKQTVDEVTLMEINSSNPVSVSAAHTHQRVSDFTSFMGQMHHFERDISRVSLDYYLECQKGHSSRAGRKSDTKSSNSLPKLCSSISVSHPCTQDVIFTESPSIISKSACQNAIVFTPSDQLSPPPSPLHYLPVAPPVSPPSSSPPLFTTPFSVCSPGSSPQQLHLHKPRALPESPSLNLDTREVFRSSQTTWRPWS